MTASSHLWLLIFWYTGVKKDMLHSFFILNINKQQGTNHDQVRPPQSLWNILFILFIYLYFLFIFVYTFYSLFFLDILYYDDNKRRLTCTGSQGGKVNFYQVDVIENSKLRLLIASSLRGVTQTNTRPNTGVL